MTIYTGFEIEVETDMLKFREVSPGNIYRFSTGKIINLAKDTKHITNTVLSRIENYHRSRTDFRTTAWRLEADASLNNGAEFISPPERMDVSIEKLLRFFEHIESSDCTTTDRCGLHVNMSADDKTLNGVNLATFITLINQRLLFKLWGYRMQNYQHVRNMQKILKIKKYDITKVYNLKRSVGAKTEDIGNALMDEKYNFVNKREINGKTYIEIRVIGGKDYHKRTEDVIQTIKHFAEAIEKAKTPEQLHKQTCKKITSYVNRNSFSSNEGIFAPRANSFYVVTEKVFANEIKQLENIHKYSVTALMLILEEKGIIPRITGYGDMTFNPDLSLGTKKTLSWLENRSLYNSSICKYFNSCINHMYNTVIINGDSERVRRAYINYINYHYIKYTYNNFGKKICLDNILKKKLKRNHGLHLPKNEPKRNLLWMLKLMSDLPSSHRKEFVSTLPITIIDYILKKKIPGIIMLAKSRKNLLKNKESVKCTTIHRTK